MEEEEVLQSITPVFEKKRFVGGRVAGFAFPSLIRLQNMSRERKLLSASPLQTFLSLPKNLRG